MSTARLPATPSLDACHGQTTATCTPVPAAGCRRPRSRGGSVHLVVREDSTPIAPTPGSRPNSTYGSQAASTMTSAVVWWPGSGRGCAWWSTGTALRFATVSGPSKSLSDGFGRRSWNSGPGVPPVPVGVRSSAVWRPSAGGEPGRPSGGGTGISRRRRPAPLLHRRGPLLRRPGSWPGRLGSLAGPPGLPGTPSGLPRASGPGSG